MSRPPCHTSPEVCTSSPAMIRSSVVLPQPEGPRKQTNSPFAIARSMSCSAVNAPKSLRMRRSSSRVSAVTGTRALLLLLRLAVVAPGPLGEHALAVRGGGGEIHLHQARLVVLRHVGQRRSHAGLRGDREVLAVQ